jgi:cytochrome c2
MAALLMVQVVTAQHTEADCDVGELIDHQNEHAQELADFHAQVDADMDSALATLYRTAIAYQALAVECGFTDTLEVEAAHEAEHAADGHDEADQLALALSVGDPEQGKILFNTFRPEVSFACATCHRVDTTEQLVGPGLLGVGSAAHDHSAHDTMSGMAGMPGMAETEEAGGHDTHHDAGAAEATPAAERTTEETIAYLHTSIMDPSAYVVPGFPDDLMPKTYAEIFTQEEIDNLVAYLLTL